MPPPAEVVVGPPPGDDDDLALPRPPGALRRFWARHPHLADAGVAAVVVLLSVPYLTIAGSPSGEPGDVATMTVLTVAGAGVLMLRRRLPGVSFAVGVAATLLVPFGMLPVTHAVLAIGIYSIAVYRSPRAAWIALGVAALLIAVRAGVAAVMLSASLSPVVGAVTTATMTLLVGVLVGANVRGRRRYLQALIDRSRQLAIERDQQAELAAAAERSRIAREMHDIVSHALTVVVALSEGAAAAASRERAREASRTTADTARAALQEMRAMLGVLRAPAPGDEPLAPLEPVDPAVVVEVAQRAGCPIVITTTGSVRDAPRPVRFALGRVVQEGVTNALRHAPGARRVAVDIRAGEEEMVVAVENDGVVDRPPGGGFGLTGLGERVRHVGGSLTVGPHGASGWLLTATLPLTPTAVAATAVAPPAVSSTASAPVGAVPSSGSSR